MLVVGPSATGVQLAAEIQRSGRQVTLSVGEHVRLLAAVQDVPGGVDARAHHEPRLDRLGLRK